jgi:hypothetical protein
MATRRMTKRQIKDIQNIPQKTTDEANEPHIKTEIG